MCKSKRWNKQTKEHIYEVYGGEEACYLYNIQEVLQPGSTNGQTNVATVEAMNHQYVHGGYFWPARLATVFVNVGVLGGDFHLWHQVTSLDYRQIGYNPFSQKCFNLIDTWSALPLAKNELFSSQRETLSPVSRFLTFRVRPEALADAELGTLTLT